MEQIAVYFTTDGVPATGLSPTVNVRERNGTQRVTNGACSELASGFYIYDFGEYNPEKQYVYMFDGGATLSDGERYKPGDNEMDAYTNKYSWGRSGMSFVDYRDQLADIKKQISIPLVVDNRIEEVIDMLNKLTGEIVMLKKDQKLNMIEQKLGTIEEKITQSNAEIVSGTNLSSETIINLIESKKEVKVIEKEQKKEIDPNIELSKKQLAILEEMKKKQDDKEEKEEKEKEEEEEKKEIEEMECVLQLLEDDSEANEVLELLENPTEEEKVLSLLLQS